MAQLPNPRSVILEGICQCQVIIVGEFVGILKFYDEKGERWVKDWRAKAWMGLRPVKFLTADKTKAKILDELMRLHYLNEGQVDPTSQGLERYRAVFRVSPPFSGNFAYKLWAASHTEEPVWYTEESFIYSDVHFLGEIRDLGPFSILNSRSYHAPTMASLTLRSKLYQSTSDFNYTFHRLAAHHPKHIQYRERNLLSVADEIASLISVATGRRLMGEYNVSRWFGQSEDPLGDPRDPGPRPEIYSDKPSILPSYSTREHSNLEVAETVLRQYFGLPIADAAKFLRAAVLFKKALLQSDEDPDLAWIWSVGAIETLAEVPGDHEGVIGRFVKFLRSHLPPPLPSRPQHLRVDWDDLKRPFEQIYEYRSEFLHAGIPFPIPMTKPPENISHQPGVEHFAERPYGGKGYGGTLYSYDASPMHLHVFMHIVQGAMLKWLELTSKKETAPESDDAPEPTKIHVDILRAADNHIRVVAMDGEDIIVDKKILSTDLTPVPLKEVLPSGYNVTSLILSRLPVSDPEVTQVSHAASVTEDSESSPAPAASVGGAIPVVSEASALASQVEQLAQAPMRAPEGQNEPVGATSGSGGKRLVGSEL